MNLIVENLFLMNLPLMSRFAEPLPRRTNLPLMNLIVETVFLTNLPLTSWLAKCLPR